MEPTATVKSNLFFGFVCRKYRLLLCTPTALKVAENSSTPLFLGEEPMAVVYRCGPRPLWLLEGLWSLS